MSSRSQTSDSLPFTVNRYRNTFLSHNIPITMARILVADDDNISRTRVCRWLASAGHDVVEACDGEQALAACLHSHLAKPVDIASIEYFDRSVIPCPLNRSGYEQLSFVSFINSNAR